MSTNLDPITLDSIITANSSMFAAGSTMTQQDLVNLFNIKGVKTTGSYQEIHRSNLRVMTVVRHINKLMRANGLYLASKKYYTEFHVKEKKATRNTVVRYSAQVEKNESCEVQLETAMVQRINAGTWGHYRSCYTSTGKRRRHAVAGNPPKGREKATKIRLSWI